MVIEKHQQSPIDIVTSAVVYDNSIKSSKLKINYEIGDAERVEVSYAVTKITVLLLFFTMLYLLDYLDY